MYQTVDAPPEPSFAPLAGGELTSCAHCGGPRSAARDDRFCSDGCATVYQRVEAQGLLAYYTLAPGARAPASVQNEESAPRERAWLVALESSIGSNRQSLVRLDVQGMQCAGCVWLLDELFQRQPGALRCEVNPTLGTAELLVSNDFSLPTYVRAVESFGYQLGPENKRPDARDGDLLLRLGVCAAIAMNAMIFSLPIYLGLEAGTVYRAFRALSFALGTTSLLVGGTVFIKAAWQGLRRGVLHLDLPIALGIVLAYAGSAWNFLLGNDRGAYFDTLSLFIALMLGGRLVQQRLLAQNRRRLLGDDGADALLTRRIENGAPQVVPCGSLKANDELLLAHGDLVPVDCELLAEGATCSLEWIRGESVSSEFVRGDVLPAGAFHVGAQAVRARATCDFSASSLRTLLRAPSIDRGEDPGRRTAFWRTLSRLYAIGVLVIATLSFAGWYAATGSVGRALEITTAVLVVTCPCAFGLATPLAYELAHAGLRRAGLFVRSAGLLDRAVSVRGLAFDKTGTLTTGALRVDDDRALRALSAHECDVLFQLTARSGHPKSVAVRHALDRIADAPHVLRDDVVVTEQPGRGVEAIVDAKTYRLGSVSFSLEHADSAPRADVYLSCDGVLRAAITTAEQPREDAQTELRQLAHEGFALTVLSGDEPSRVRALCDGLPVQFSRVEGGLSPDGKAQRVRELEAAQGPVLMVGDGVNDAPAFAVASCAGTPAIDRPFVPARADFYFTTAGLRPLRLLLRVARALARVHQQNLAIALSYNVLTVGLAVSGRMSPLLCAGLMPLSSLVTVAFTARSLSSRRSLWT